MYLCLAAWFAWIVRDWDCGPKSEACPAVCCLACFVSQHVAWWVGGGVVLFPHLVVCTSHDFSRSVLRFLSLSPKLAVQSVIEGFLKRTYMKRIWQFPFAIWSLLVGLKCSIVLWTLMPCDNSRPHYRHPTESPWCVVAFCSKIAKLYQAQLGHGFLGT